MLTLLGRQGEISGLRAGHIQTLSNLEDLEVTNRELENVHILVTTPLKLCNLSILGYDMTKFKQIIFDEADKYFELSFMKQFSSILDSLKKSSRANYYLFSATFPPGNLTALPKSNFLEIERQLKDVFTDPIEIIIRGKMTVLDTIE